MVRCVGLSGAENTTSEGAADTTLMPLHYGLPFVFNYYGKTQELDDA